MTYQPACTVAVVLSSNTTTALTGPSPASSYQRPFSVAWVSGSVRVLAVLADRRGLGEAAGDDHPALAVDPEIAERGQRPERLVELVEVRRKALRIGRDRHDRAGRVRIGRGRRGVEGDHGRRAGGCLDGARAGIDEQFAQPHRIVLVALALVAGRCAARAAQAFRTPPCRETGRPG